MVFAYETTWNSFELPAAKYNLSTFSFFMKFYIGVAILYNAKSYEVFNHL